MNLQNTTGGVSPIKKRGGRSAAGATSTGRRRGGFGQHKVGGGLNLGGYNVHTRFKPSKKWTPPSSGGTTKLGDKPTKKSDGGEKPYSFDKDGKLVFSPTININNNPTNINKNANVNNPGGGTSSTTTTTENSGYWENQPIVTKEETKSLESYKSTWERNKDGIKDKYDNYDDYVAAAEKWWKSESGQKKKEERKSGSKTTSKDNWVWIDGKKTKTTTKEDKDKESGNNTTIINQ